MQRLVKVVVDLTTAHFKINGFPTKSQYVAMATRLKTDLQLADSVDIGEIKRVLIRQLGTCVSVKFIDVVLMHGFCTGYARVKTASGCPVPAQRTKKMQSPECSGTGDSTPSASYRRQLRGEANRYQEVRVPVDCFGGVPAPWRFHLGGVESCNLPLTTLF